MSPDVVVPWLEDGPARDHALNHVVGLWDGLGHRVLIGELDDGPWIKARAVEVAMRRSMSDVVVIADADVWTDPSEAIARVEAGAPWAVPHRRVLRLSEGATRMVYDGATFEWAVDHGGLERPAYLGHAGGGMTVVRRDVYERVPLDPRFEGWGQEDDAWALALRNLHPEGRRWRGDAPMFHLWHPSQPRRSPTTGSEASWVLYRRYTAASGHRARMEALVGEYAARSVL